MAEPSLAELGPLLEEGTLGESMSLDEPSEDPYGDENNEFMSAAKVAVGTDAKANALKDAMVACLREHGLIGAADDAAEEELDDEVSSSVGSGFDDL